MAPMDCRKIRISIHFKARRDKVSVHFLASGITIQVEGDANDYVGKGLSGGR